MPNNDGWVDVPTTTGDEGWQDVPGTQQQGRRLAQRVRPGESIYARDPRVPAQDIRGAATIAPEVGAGVGAVAGSMVGAPNIGMGAGEAGGRLVSDIAAGKPPGYKRAAIEGLMTAGGGKLIGEGVGALGEEGLGPLARRIGSSKITGRVVKGAGAGLGYLAGRWPGMIVGREAGGAISDWLSRMGGAESEAAGYPGGLPSRLSERVSSSESPGAIDAELPKGTGTRTREGGKFSTGETTSTGTPKSRQAMPLTTRGKKSLTQKIAESPADDILSTVGAKQPKKRHK